MRIGIPRALFYYHYYPLWKGFFEALGQEVILSSPTNKNILKQGIGFTVDDACLPVKLFHGHVSNLIGKVDAIFIPRIISIEAREYICPKFLGLPDMVKSNIPNLPTILDMEMNLYKNNFAILEHFLKVGEALGKGKIEVTRAYLTAKYRYDSYKIMLKRHELTPPEALAVLRDSNQRKKTKPIDTEYTVLVLGHPYNIYDDYLSLNLIQKLQKRKVKVVTYEMVADKNIRRGAKRLTKDMFWTLGKNILGCAHYFLEDQQIDGMINVASFGCGPDSLVGELLEHKVNRDYDMPFLYINLDEQSGEAGFDTRIEAFLDILEGRRTYESYFSTHG